MKPSKKSAKKKLKQIDLNPRFYAIRPSKELHAEVSSRFNLGERGPDKMNHHRVAKRDLLRYYELINTARKDLNFTAEEGYILSDALGKAKSAAPKQYINQHQSGHRDLLRYDELWIAFDAGVGPRPTREQAALSKKLRRLTPAESIAVMDVVERYWVLIDQKGVEFSGPALVEVGLVHEPENLAAAGR